MARDFLFSNAESSPGCVTHGLSWIFSSWTAAGSLGVSAFVAKQWTLFLYVRSVHARISYNGAESITPEART